MTIKATQTELIAGKFKAWPTSLGAKYACSAEFASYLVPRILSKGSRRCRDSCHRNKHYLVDSGKGGSCNILLELVPFRLMTAISPVAKLLEPTTNARQGLSHNQRRNISEVNSWSHFSGSAIVRCRQ